MYTTTTHSIAVTVEPTYLDAESRPRRNRYVWAYHVTIENKGMETVQLLSRYWKITDALGRTQEVRGEGVIGEQPVIRPGESYEYSSGTPLSTPSGIMMGRYYMETADGRPLEVEIPAFSLDSPEERSPVN
ncbi:MAG: Co2+/Mg2+ efflux protein ApaG [Alphaproteobacteria bacterium]|nr:Co2+/Mg2+ efflux protein ApaG [Alphaproteobacteria bacterium]